ncbi:uncharacterized protein BHQ10_005141 [Talaromyces amestolkiae]|uniref:NXF1/2/3/5-like leucine-rich repeat domain-containing protein n=1 Tax=Talaromyces amestolkiae TaxID=1196081 RepID=A0A364L008_TALAM|nr:uncharacterized protein BHQ10_005141 [Talaromyces amestolkiae]RAO69129.1 hypothetical protein BHQ10_005141 [Talaromyces amestolkiae]
MEKLNSEDGQLFIKNLASFVRTHEKALANALQLRRQSVPSNNYASSTSSTLAAALSFGALKFTSQNVKPAKLTLTPHHLFYLLSQFEDLSIAVGSMNVRLENIHNDSSSSYVSFLNQPRRTRGDRDSIHSVSSVRSVMSGMSAVWSSFGLGSKDSVTKSEKAKAALDADLKYLYSAFTKIPCLRLAPDRRARLIRGYEEFPLDTAVPLHAFKNLSALEIIDIDYRSFYGWDRLSEQLRTLTLKRANINDPTDLLTKIVLDDVDKRRRRPSKSYPSPIPGGSMATTPQPVYKYDDASSTSNTHKPVSAPGSPSLSNNLATSTSPKSIPMIRGGSEGERGHRRTGSYSPTRPQTSSRQHTQNRHSRGHSINKVARSSSGSSNSSEVSLHGNRSSSNLLAGVLPPTKWRFLRHLGLADNSLTTLPSDCFMPVANTLHSLDLSSNLFAEIPDSLPSLVALRALNLSNCMINSLRSIAKNPLPAITALNLRGNRLSSLAGIERLLSLERLDLRDNNLTDPTEIARLTGLPEIREIWVSGNPFTKTHSNYRVTIFNLFRRTPGFTEDIIIDASGPGYSERKQLVDRVAEPESAPVVRPVELEPAKTVSKVPAPVRQELLSQDITTAAAVAAATEATGTAGTTHRKRGNRRRIVDLSREESVTQVFTSPSSQNKPLPPNPPVLVDPFIPSGPTKRKEDATISPVDVEPVKKPITQPVSQNQKVVPAKQDAIDWNANFSLGGESNIFRPRLEAVHNSNSSSSNSWLNVLHEGNWQTQQTNMSAVPRTGTVFDASMIRPDAVSRPESHLLVSGRTVG